MSEPGRVKCVGLFGWIFGHKFIKSTLESTFRSEFCFRCGMPEGGWGKS